MNNRSLGKVVKRRNTLRIISPIFVVFLVVIVVLAIVIFLLSLYPETRVETIRDVVTVAGILGAILALSFSYITFKSIDTVSVISKMEGNILENSHYIKNIIGLIKDFELGEYSPIITKQEEAREAFLNKLKSFESKRKLTTSGTLVADELQYSLDFMPIMAFLMVKSNRFDKQNQDLIDKEYARVMFFRTNYNNYVDSLSKYLENLNNDSNGSIRVLQEARSLIDATAKYQFAQNKFEDEKNEKNLNELFEQDGKESLTAIMKIDSSLLRNIPCRCLYYKYLGLSYMKCANRMLSDNLTDDIDVIKERREKFYSMNDDDKYFIRANFDEAKKCFSKVLELAGDDLFWSTIYYDLARVEFFQTFYGIGSGEDTRWQVSMQKAIENRFRLVCNLNQALDKNRIPYNKQNPIDENTPFFRAAMIEQYHQAVLFDILFRMLGRNDEENRRMIENDFNRLPQNHLPSRSRKFDDLFEKLKIYFTNEFLKQ